MAWTKVNKGGNYLRFEAGKSIEGAYLGYTERDNPFFDANKENSPEKIIDYKFEINKKEQVLSSTAKTLRYQLLILDPPCMVKIDFCTKGLKKYYTVWISE